MFHLRENPLTWCVYALVMITLTLAAFQGLPDLLIDTDDHDYFNAAATVKAENSLLFPLGDYTSGRPVAEHLFRACYALWQDNYAPYHHLVVVLHLVAGLLLAFTLRRLGVPLEPSLLTGLLFLLNVAHFRAVHWIACLPYPLALIFGLAVLLCYARFLHTERSLWLALAAALLILAVFSHPATIAIAPFCIYWGWRKGLSAKRIFASTWMLLAVVLGCLATHYTVYTQAVQVHQASALPSLLDNVESFFWFLGMLVLTAHWFPAGLSFQPELWIVGVGMATGLAALLACRRKNWPVIDCAVWTVLMLIPFTSIQYRLLVGPSRYLYFASVGTSLCLACGLFELNRLIANRRKLLQGRVVLAVFLAGLIASSLVALHRVKALSFYMSGRSYNARSRFELGVRLTERAFAQSADLLPSNAYYELIATSLGLGKPQEEILNKALERYPDALLLNMLAGVSAFLHEDPQRRKAGAEKVQEILDTAENGDLHTKTALAYNNLATFYLRQKNYERAIELYSGALRIFPGYPTPLYHLARAYEELGRLEEAVHTCRTLLKIHPAETQAMARLGKLLLKTGRPDEAVLYFQKALTASPPVYEACLNLASLLEQQGRVNEAIRTYQSYLEREPGGIRAMNNLGLLLLRQGDPETAIRYFSRAIEIDPEYALAYYNLATLLLNRGSASDSIPLFEKFAQLQPDRWEAHLGLAQAREAVGQRAKAIESCRRALRLAPENVQVQKYLAALQAAPLSNTAFEARRNP